MIPAGYPRDLPSALLRAARDFGTSGVVEIGPDGRETRLDFPTLLELAARILAGLRANGVRAGDPAVVHCTEPVGFFAAFWACTLGGIRPLLMAPAAEGDRTEEGRERLRKVTDLLGWTVLIGRPSDLPDDLGLPVLDPDALAGHEPTSEFHRPAADDVAVLMMSSGSSTGTPKIIQLTHRGLVEFAAGTPAMLPVRPGQTTLNWLPLDHSGAFLLYHLLPVFAGCTNIHVATDWVLSNPLRWLDLMDAHRVNHSWAPNFGYRLVTAAIAGEPDRHWDLSALRSLVSGGEQITVPVMSEFLRLTNRFGVVPETFVAAWGMTETVTGITFARPGLTPNVHRVRIPPTGVVEWVDQRATAGKVAVARPGKTRAEAPGVLSLVSVGTPAPGATVRIVGPNGAVLPEGRIGQLQIASARVTPGYLGNPDADRAAFPAGNWPARKWLATGDQAFITGGQVVITGRDSERIILNGQNYYAHDIETVAASVPGAELGLVAACGIADASSGTERLVVFFATTEPFEEGSPDAVAEAIRGILHDRLKLTAQVVGVPRRHFPTTPGGKILRPLLKQRFIDGSLNAPNSPYGEPLRANTPYDAPAAAEDDSEQTTELPVVRLAWRRTLADSIPTPPQRPTLGANRHTTTPPPNPTEPPADAWRPEPITPETPEAGHPSTDPEPTDPPQLADAKAPEADPQQPTESPNPDPLTAPNEVETAAADAAPENLTEFVEPDPLTASDGPEAPAPAADPTEAAEAAEPHPFTASNKVEASAADAEPAEAAGAEPTQPTEAPDPEPLTAPNEVEAPAADAEPEKPTAAAEPDPLTAPNEPEAPAPAAEPAEAAAAPESELLTASNEVEAPAADAELTEAAEPAEAAASAKVEPSEIAGPSETAESTGPEPTDIAGEADASIADGWPAEAADAEPAETAEAEPTEATEIAEPTEVAAADAERGESSVAVASEDDEPAEIAESGESEPAAVTSGANAPVVDGEPTEPAVDADSTDPVVDAGPTEPAVDAEPTERVVDAGTTEPVVAAGPTEPVVDAESTEPVVDAGSRQAAAEGELTEATESAALVEVVASADVEPSEIAGTAESTGPEPAVEANAPVGDEAAESAPAAVASEADGGAPEGEAGEPPADAEPSEASDSPAVAAEADVPTPRGEPTKRSADAEPTEATEGVESAVAVVSAVAARTEAAEAVESAVAVVSADAARTVATEGVESAVAAASADAEPTEIAESVEAAPAAVTRAADVPTLDGEPAEQVADAEPTERAADAERTEPGVEADAEEVGASMKVESSAASGAEEIAEAIDAAVESDEVSAKADEPSTESNESSAESDEASADSEERPAASDEPAAASDEPSTESDEVSAKADEPPTESDESPAASDEPSADSEQPPAASDEPPAESDEPSTESGELSADSDQLSAESGELVADSDEVSTAAEQVVGEAGEAGGGAAEAEVGTDEGLVGTGDGEGESGVAAKVAVVGGAAAGDDFAEGVAAPEVVAAGVGSAGAWVADVVGVFRGVLGEDVDERTGLIGLGVDSVAMVRVHTRLQDVLGIEFPRAVMFEQGSILALSNYLERHADEFRSTAAAHSTEQVRSQGKPARKPAKKQVAEPIAIIGLAARFPGADTLEQFWDNLAGGVESLRRFTPDEVGGAKDAFGNEELVAVSGALDDVESFDAEFFGLSDREAELTDPAQRIFLEVCQHALEHGGHAGAAGRIGIFAGSGMNLYTQQNQPPDFLATRVAYRLGLTGPAIGVQAAWSSSLVAVHLACQALRSGDADLALAGAAAVHVPQATGYHPSPESILSPTGHVRVFDAAADGTVGGNGVAAVLLKRLDQAVKDGDTVYAVIRGSAVSNETDQADLIEHALEKSGVPADSISYIEANATGTAVEDAREFRALATVLRKHTDKVGFCTIGSVKPNIGHLDSAAGMAGLIKTVLMLQHRTLVPTINHTKVDPELPITNSPFVIGTELREWESGTPLRAGVSALDVGGTSAHVILEEAPRQVRRGDDGPVVLPLSAPDPEALTELVELFRADLEHGTGHRLIDLASTAALGRQAHRHRVAVTGASEEELAEALGTAQAVAVPRGGPGPLGFAFTGQGAARRGMAAGLAARFPVFRSVLDECDKVYAEEFGGSLLELLLTPAGGSEGVWPTETAQPALFAFEVALARLWQSFGVQPALVVGHSVGEYAALCVAGALSLADGVRLTAKRGELMQRGTVPGAMVAVRADADRVRELAQSSGVEIAAGNGPQSFVLTGTEVIVGQLAEQLDRLEVSWQRLDVDRAFHSSLVDPILGEFADVVAQISLRPLRMPMVSSWSGELLESGTALDSDYLVGQLRQPVLFGDAVEALTAAGCRRFLELGPDAVLSPAGRRIAPNSTWIPAQRLGQDPVLATMNGLAELYAQGTEIAWSKVYPNAGRVPLPLYPFRRVHHPVDTTSTPLAAPVASSLPGATDLGTAARPVMRAEGGEARFRPALKKIPLDPPSSNGFTEQTPEEPEEHSPFALPAENTHPAKPAELKAAPTPATTETPPTTEPSSDAEQALEAESLAVVEPPSDREQARDREQPSEPESSDEAESPMGVESSSDDGQSAEAESRDAAEPSSDADPDPVVEPKSPEVEPPSDREQASEPESSDEAESLMGVESSSDNGQSAEAESRDGAEQSSDADPDPVVELKSPDEIEPPSDREQASEPESSDAVEARVGVDSSSDGEAVAEFGSPDDAESPSDAESASADAADSSSDAGSASAGAVESSGDDERVVEGEGLAGAESSGDGGQAAVPQVASGVGSSALGEQAAEVETPGGGARAADEVAERYRDSLAVVLDLTGEQLGLDPYDVTVDHTFAELGADSLSMLRVVEEVGQRFGVELAVSELFDELDTPHKLASAVASRNLSDGAVDPLDLLRQAVPEKARADEAGAGDARTDDTGGAEADAAEADAGEAGAAEAGGAEAGGAKAGGAEARGADAGAAKAGAAKAGAAGAGAAGAGAAGAGAAGAGAAGGKDSRTALAVLGSGLAELAAKVDAAAAATSAADLPGSGMAALMSQQLRVAGQLVDGVTKLMHEQLALLNESTQQTRAEKPTSAEESTATDPNTKNAGTANPQAAGDAGTLGEAGIADAAETTGEARAAKSAVATEARVAKGAGAAESAVATEARVAKGAGAAESAVATEARVAKGAGAAESAVATEARVAKDAGAAEEAGAAGSAVAKGVEAAAGEDSESAKVVAGGAEGAKVAAGGAEVAGGKDAEGAKERRGGDLAFWRGMLAGAQPLVLPTDQPRPAARPEVASAALELDSELGDAIFVFSRERRVSPLMTMLAAVGTVLGRFAAQDDITIGTAPLRGAKNTSTRGTRALPLRIDLSGEPQLGDLAQRVGEITIAAFDHASVDLAVLEQDPLFQVLVEFEPGDDDLAPGLDLRLRLAHHPGGIRCTADYRSGLFDQATIERVLHYLEAVLRRAIADPELSLPDLMLPIEADRVLLNELEGEPAPSGPIGRVRRNAVVAGELSGLHTLFEQQVARTPDAVAVIQGDRELTYAELNRRSNAVAWQLVDLGVKPGQLVAVRVARGAELVIAVLAVLKSGAAYLPLDPGVPESRWSFMVADSGAVALVGDDAALADRLGLRLVPVTAVDGDPRAKQAPPVRAAADDVAYCIYTSGSTGNPKGVAVPHRGPVNLVRHYLRTRRSLRTLQWTSFGFDVHVQELFTALASGAALVVIGEDDRYDPDEVVAALTKYEVERLFMTFTPLTALLATMPELPRLPALREIVAGGEAMVLTHGIKEFLAAHPDCVLYNEYGPTEASVVTTIHQVDPAEERPSIGRPIDGVVVRLLDEALRPVPVGAIGEIHLGGASVAQGYLGRPDETEAAFVDDPAHPGGRLYRTRDLGRWRTDGTLDYLGRVDDQVKIRGHRVEPGETEYVLADLPGVVDAVVVANTDPAGDTCLIGYVVLEDSDPAVLARLLLELTKELPIYLVPADLIPIEELPLDASGKLDRARLPEPEWLKA